MVTSTTSTTATPTPTPTPTAQSAVNDATQALLKGLSAGSGVDTGTLVTSLVSAQFAARTAALKTKSDTLTAQISGVGTLKSTMTGFSTALANLVKGGSLQTQPASSNGAILSATAQSGAKLSGLSSSITVTRLATGQVARTTTAVDAEDRATSLGTGALTLNIGGKDTVIDVGDGSIDAIAAGINASKTGVTASVVTDANGGAYLSVKGTTGSANAFTLKGQKGDALDIGGSTATKTSLVSTAQNAQLTVDGIAVERPGNTVSDLVTGVTLQLNGISTVPVSLTSTPPTDALTQAVNDVVTTYNEVLKTITEQTDPITGNLRADPAAKSLLRSLQALVSKPLVGGAIAGLPRSLSEIGVATNTDGTLRVDSALLAKQLAANPDTIEAMFAPPGTNALGLSATLTALTTSATSTVTGLGASTVRYTAAEADVAKQQDKVTDQSAQLTTRLTQQYASMNSRVSAYKSTQTFLTNQIAAWNKDS
ncbi:flagellar hook-associated protein 2 [Sphingomonas sp. PP-CE-1A-559]|uniref:flagellar filament capping protein FliD n=1 Tax=Sphingomonas sp. PP-CE-1A-559 TaxID=2135657 RepID=UPI001055AAC3|nr:flagellar filament capping protein FliD [Sphingomonas sp. PP-CE-1A-559]TCP88543.1 flagellar hook-associated protein 2 [Sphingomonas sp. PP-CE-1A-559]